MLVNYSRKKIYNNDNRFPRRCAIRDQFDKTFFVDIDNLELRQLKQ
jgi:hypothetical protein